VHFTAGSSELVIVSGVVDHFNTLKHAEIFDFLFPDNGAVVSDENELGFSSSDTFFD